MQSWRTNQEEVEVTLCVLGIVVIKSVIHSAHLLWMVHWPQSQLGTNFFEVLIREHDL